MPKTGVVSGTFQLNLEPTLHPGFTQFAGVSVLSVIGLVTGDQRRLGPRSPRPLTGSPNPAQSAVVVATP